MTVRFYSTLPPGFMVKSLFKVLVPGGLIFVGIELYTGNEKFYRNQVMPLVHKMMDPEATHRLAVGMAKYGILSRFSQGTKSFPELKCSLFGRDLDNPIGLAAGFDKNGEAIESLKKVGFGLVEVGSITPKPQSGNEKPRVFLLPNDEAIVNSYGFNNDGIGIVSNRIKKAYNQNPSVLLGVNLGKNKTTEEASSDYEIGIAHVISCSDYIVLNVSSPNTPGLRSLQNEKQLRNLLKIAKDQIERVRTSPDRPKLFLKLSPDLSPHELQAVAKVSLDQQYGIDALILTNTTTSRPGNLKTTNEELLTKPGGLSGKPLAQLSTDFVAQVYKLTDGRIPIIGCGGVSSGEDAYKKIRAGASLVQLYTAIAFQGFPVIGRIKRELVELLKRDGFSNVSQAIGADHRKNAS